MKEYEFPNVDRERVVYKGRRFWVIALSEQPDSNLRGFSKNDADYVFYDAKAQRDYDEGLIGFIHQLPDGSYRAGPNFSHVDISFQVASMREAVKQLTSVIEEYFKATVG